MVQEVCDSGMAEVTCSAASCAATCLEASTRPLRRPMPPLDSQRHVTASSARSTRRREIEALPNTTVARVGPVVVDALETGGKGGGWVGEGGGREGEGGGVDGDG